MSHCNCLWGKDQCESWHRLLGIKEVQIYGTDVGYLWEVLPKYQDVPDICICEQRPPITPMWTLSSTRETIMSARKPTTWDESIHRVWRQRRRWVGAKGEIWKSLLNVMADQQLEGTREERGDDEDINNVDAVNPRSTGVNTLLSTQLRLTHTMTVTEHHTTWATLTAHAVPFLHSFTPLSPSYFIYICAYVNMLVIHPHNTARRCLFCCLLRVLLQHHPRASSWWGGSGEGLCRPERSWSDLLHPCIWTKETFVLSQLWWATHCSTDAKASIGDL